MKKVIWRDNQVISLEISGDREEKVYALAQMVDGCYMVVFNLFSTDNSWENVDLRNVPILFCTAVLKSVYRSGNAFRQNIEPLRNYKRPDIRIKPFSWSYRYVTLWEGTPDEMQVLVLGLGGGTLIQGELGKHSVLMPEISYKDDDTIDGYEMTTMQNYPIFQERLYLCYKFGKNVDPLKDLTFNRPIPIDYKNYMVALMS